MGLIIGPGLDAWCKQANATPIGNEAYPWLGLQMSSLPILIGNSDGKTIRTLVGWDGINGVILEPGPGAVVVQPVAFELMFDSTTSADIPATAPIVGGYVDGAYAWRSADWALHPNAKQITISVFGVDIADGYDSEPGDLTPEEAAAAIQNSPASMGYGTLRTLAEIKKALVAAGNMQVLRGWPAHWTGVEHICGDPDRGGAGCFASVGLTAADFAGIEILATQYASPETGSGGHYDISLVTPAFLADF